MVLAAVGVLLFGELAWAEEEQDPVRLPVALEEEVHPDQVEVVKGDHLWKISGQRLENELGRAPSNGEISPYWREVIKVNLPRLRSGDPDLIYPGEVVTLPDPYNAGT